MLRPRSRVAALAVLCIVPAAATAQETKGRGAVVLRAARLIDGTGADPVADGVVVIEGEKIKAVGKGGEVAGPDGAKVIGLGVVTLLPGFIDAHTHIIGRQFGEPGADLGAV